MTPTTPTPDQAQRLITPGLTFDEYQQIEAVNFSSLKSIQISERAYTHAITNKAEPTDEMDKGSALHSMLLEPHTFQQRYAIWHGGRRAGAEWKAFEDAYSDRTILKAEDADEIGNWAAMCESDPVVGAELTAIQHRELSVTWTDKATGIGCKSRVDGHYGKTVIDIKTTIKPTPEEFERDAMYRLYPAQMAFYLDGISGGKPRGWNAKILCVFKGDSRGQYPADCWVMEMSEEVIEHGRQLYKHWLRTVADLRQSLASGRPALGAGKGQIQTMTLPAWAEAQLPMLSLASGDDDAAILM